MNQSTKLSQEQLSDKLINEDKQQDDIRQSLTQHDARQQAQNARPKAKTPGKTFWRLFQFTLKHKSLLITANIAMIVSGFGLMFLPTLSGQMIDHIKNGDNLLNDVQKFSLFSILLAVFSAIRGYSFNLLGQKVVLGLRKKLFQELIEKDIVYYDKNKSGALISRLTSDVEVVQSAASDNISILLRNLLLFLGSLAFLYVISWKLTTFIIVVTPIISVIIILIVRVMKRLKKQYQTSLAYANSLANEVFGNIRVVKSFSNEQSQYNNYSNLINKTYKVGRKQAMFYALILFIMVIFANFLVLSVLYFGGELVIQGELSIGNLTSFVLYTITLTTSFTSVSGIMNQIISAMGVCESIFQIIDEPVKIVNGHLSPRIGQSDYVVEFENATFSYPTKQNVNVIQNLTLKIKKGQSVALVGSSGSGKSSLVNLILRFYDLNEGKLNVGGRNIKQIDLSQLRRQIGIVSQQPTLFSGSLRQNIEYGIKNNEKNQTKIFNALKIANAQFALDQKIFPQKLETLVGQRGVKLSGGQKQRIAIARSIIKEPQLLIFDEATSALDAESQSLVQNAIDKLVQSHQRTMLVIAHRLSTIINCDRIIVLKNGKIVEEGKHKQLIAAKGHYANLVQKQISSL